MGIEAVVGDEDLPRRGGESGHQRGAAGPVGGRGNEAAQVVAQRQGQARRRSLGQDALGERDKAAGRGRDRGGEQERRGRPAFELGGGHPDRHRDEVDAGDERVVVRPFGAGSQGGGHDAGHRQGRGVEKAGPRGARERPRQQEQARSQQQRQARRRHERRGRDLEGMAPMEGERIGPEPAAGGRMQPGQQRGPQHDHRRRVDRGGPAPGDEQHQPEHDGEGQGGLLREERGGHDSDLRNLLVADAPGPEPGKQPSDCETAEQPGPFQDAVRNVHREQS